MRKRFLEKVRSTRGESLGETLVSLLIIAVAMTMLAGSIVSAAKVNKEVKDYDTSFQNASPAPVPSPTDGQVTFTLAGGTKTVKVDVYTTGTASASAPSSGSDDYYVYPYVYYEVHSGGDEGATGGDGGEVSG